MSAAHAATPLTLSNPWHSPRNIYSRPTFTLTAKPVQHKGFDIYDQGENNCFAVKDGVIVAQCVTINGMRRSLDLKIKLGVISAAGAA